MTISHGNIHVRKSKLKKIVTNKSKINNDKEKQDCYRRSVFICEDSRQPGGIINGSSQQKEVTILDTKSFTQIKSIDYDTPSSNKSDSSSFQSTKKSRSFQEVVLYDMITAAKPFSMKGLVKLTHSSQAQLHYLMLSLMDKNLVIRKEFGKNGEKSLFWVNFDARDIFKAACINSVDSNQKELAKKQLDTLLNENQDKNFMIETLLSAPTNSKIDEQIKSAADTLEGLRVELTNTQAEQLRYLTEFSLRRKKSLTQSKVELCPQLLKKQINVFLNEWRVRKSKCMDFIDNLSDAMERKPSHVLKLLDIESDASAGLSSLPSSYDL